MHSILNDVLISDDSWLFAYEGTNAIHSILQGKSSLNKDQIQAWKQELEQRQSFCASFGAAYHFIILPLKQCVYKEKLKHYPISDNRPAMQLQEHTPAKYPLSFFQELKKQEHCYYQYDTHWNDFACDQLYAGLLKQKLPSGLEKFYTTPLHDLWIKISSEPCPQALCWRYPQNNIIYYNEIVNIGGLILCENPKHSRLVGVIFGDSFTRFSINTISQYFSHVFFFQTTGFDKEILRQIQPDIVINCHAENFIHAAEEIRFQSFFEALLYKFLISGDKTVLQQKELVRYALFMPEEQIEILQELILLFRNPKFTLEQIIEHLGTRHKLNKERLIQLVSYKKVS